MPSTEAGSLLKSWRASSVAQMVALAVLLVGAVGFGWRQLDQRRNEARRMELAAKSAQLDAKVTERMRSYAELLRAAAGLFAASEDVSRKDFQTFVDALDLDVVYPGVQGVGFSAAVPPCSSAWGSGRWWPKTASWRSTTSALIPSTSC